MHFNVIVVLLSSFKENILFHIKSSFGCSFFSSVLGLFLRSPNPSLFIIFTHTPFFLFFLFHIYSTHLFPIFLAWIVNSGSYLKNISLLAEALSCLFHEFPVRRAEISIDKWIHQASNITHPSIRPQEKDYRQWTVLSTWYQTQDLSTYH